MSGHVHRNTQEAVQVGIFRDFRNYGRVHRATRADEVTAVNKSSTRILRGIGQVAGAALRAAITVLKLDDMFGAEVGIYGLAAA